MKKQNMIEQSQRDYMNFMCNKQKIESQEQGFASNSFRKKNSKLMEINTFKIGSENREIKRKNYQEYNEGLNLNPTKNYMPPPYNSNKPASAHPLGDLSSYNNMVSYGGVPQNQPNKDLQAQDKPYTGELGTQPNLYYSDFKGQGQQHEINPYNKLNQGATDNQQRPPSGSSQVNQYQSPYSQNQNDQEQYNNYREVNTYENYPQNIPINPYSQQNDYNNYKPEINPYESYKIEPIKSLNQMPKQPPKPQKKKVDLNSIPVPEFIKTVEDYESYLVSLGIDPLTLEYIEDSNPPKQEELESQFNNLNISNNANYNNPYSNNLESQTANYQHSQPNLQQQQRETPQKHQPSKSVSPYLPNYGIKPSYKNQSSLVLGDASTYQKNKVPEIKKDYEPLVKVKPLVINPCKFNIYSLHKTPQRITISEIPV